MHSKRIYGVASLFFCMFLIFGSCRANESQKIAWVTQNARVIDTVQVERPLADMSKSFDSIVGEAAVIALGESGHGIRDAQRFRTRFFEYLVKRKGVRAIILESGFYEGQIANRYVHGMENDIRMTLRNGFTHNMGPWEESRELLEWMRSYNAKQTDPREKIHFYGMDLPNFQDAVISRTPAVDSPLEQVLEFVKKADAECYRRAGKRIEELACLSCKTIDDVADFFEKKQGVRYIDPDFLDELCSISYENLKQEEKQELSYLLTQTIETLEIRRLRYLAEKNVSREEYETALQMARFCRHILGNLEFRKPLLSSPNIETIRKYLGFLYPPEELARLGLHNIRFQNTLEGWRGYFEARNGRERAMADNANWIIAKHKKVLVYAHNSHLSRQDYKSQNPLHDMRYGVSVGQYLAEKYGRDYVMIAQTMDRFVDEKGNALAQGHGGVPIPATQDCKESIEYVLRKARPDLFALDLRNVSHPAVKKWLEGYVKSRFSYDFLEVSPLKAFDALVFIRNMPFAIPVKQ